MARLGFLLLIAAACGNITRKSDDAGVRDDAPGDTVMVTTDAAVDAPPDALVIPPTEARDITSGGARMTGTTYTFDVELGHGLQQIKATGTTYTVEGNAGIKQ